MSFARCIACFLVLAATETAFAQAIVATVAVPGGFDDAAVDSTRNLAYIAAGEANAVGIVDGATRRAISVPVGRRPQFLAVNTLTNRIYASNSDDSTLSVIDGATHAVTTLAIGGSGPVVVNERANKIYVIRRGSQGEVTVVDGATNTWFTLHTGSSTAWQMVLNPDTSRLYVSHAASGELTVVDVASTSENPPMAIVAIPEGPSFLALDRARNKVYAQTNVRGASVVAIDGATNAVTRIAVPDLGATGIGVNPATGRVYAGFNPNAAVIDGNANTLIDHVGLINLNHFVVDTAANRIFALEDGNRVAVIDGVSNVFTEVQLTKTSQGLAFNPATRQLFSAGGDIIDAGAAAAAPAHRNYQGLWWNAPAGSEPGWGLAIAQQGEKIFAAWFTYDASARATWYVMPNGEWQGGETWSGSLYRATGPSLFASSFDSSAVSSTVVGGLLVSFSDGNAGVMRGTLDGRPFQKSIARQVFGPLPTCEFSSAAPTQPNYTGLWWNSPAGSESGWGMFLAHQGDNLFSLWFTYAADGAPTWLVGNAVRNGGVYSGTFYATAGSPALTTGRTYMQADAAGTITLNFSDASNGSFAYSAFSARGFKAITREIFASPPTVCR